MFFGSVQNIMPGTLVQYALAAGVYIYINRQEQTKTNKRKKTEIIAARGGVRALPLRTRLVHNYAVL